MESMEQTVSPARKIIGELIVPGELPSAEQALLLAVMAEGESHIRNAPPAIGRLANLLSGLGARIARKGRELTIQGSGLRGFTPAGSILDLSDMGDIVPPLLALLVGQTFTSRVKLSAEQEHCRQLFTLLAPMSAQVGQEMEDTFAVGGAKQLVGVAHEPVDVEPAVKLALLIAGLYAEGTTSLRESAGNRNRMERFLRERQVTVERRRQEDSQYLVSIAGGQTFQTCDVDIAGDLRLAYPLMVAALARRGSDLQVKRVALRSGQRGFLDLLRQIGAEIAIEDLGNDAVDLAVSYSELIPTRVAGQRMEKVIEQLPLLAVLATQTSGEFVIRDVAHLRQGEFDYVAHLFELLKQIEARVGEYPEGIVVKGGLPLRGARIDAVDDPGLAMAFAVAGLLAESEMVIAGCECLDSVYPDFFATLHSLREKR